MLATPRRRSRTASGFGIAAVSFTAVLLFVTFLGSSGAAPALIPSPGHSGYTPAGSHRAEPTGSAVTPTVTSFARALAWGLMPAPPTGSGAGGGMAPDPIGQDAVLFGGETGGVLSRATQVYNESTNSWSVLTPSSAPSARSDFAFGANESGRVAVLFGGLVNATTLRVDNSTWLYHFPTRSWVNVSASVAPPPREDAAFAVDPVAGFALLYGGWNQNYTPTSTETFSDLWKFSFASDSWTQLHPSGTTPPPLQGAMFSWDPLTGLFLLYGGCYPCSSSVWAYNPVSGTWSLLPAAGGAVPAPRADGAWSWDPVDDAAVLFGGTNGATTFNDTFEYLPSNNSWVEQAVSFAPSPRSNVAAAWLNVPGNETLLLSGGREPSPLGPDLWRLAPTANLSLLVRNSSSGLPLPSARIVLDGSFGGSTDAAGYLNLTQVNAIETVVNVSLLGYADAELTFWIAPASSTAEEFDLEPVAPANVSVRVVMNGTGLPVDGARVNLTVEGQLISGPSETTDPRGYLNYSYVPSARPAPNATVVASSPLNYTASTSFPLFPGSDLRLVVNLTRYPWLELEVTGLLANQTLAPVQYASVSEDGTFLDLTGTNGWLNITSRDPGGNVTIGITAEGFAPFASHVTLPRSGNFSALYQLQGFTFGRIEVTVLDQKSGATIVGATVRGTSVPLLSSVAVTVVAVSRIIGPATLFVPPGYYSVNVSAYGYYPFNTSSPLAVGSNAVVPLSVNLTLLPGADINVLVRAAGGGPPLPSARVVMGSLPASLTNSAGWSNFTNVHFGPTVLSVSDPGYANNSTTLLLDPEERIPEYLVNLTPLPVGTSGPGNGSGPFGGYLPSGATVWPYVLVLVLTVVGALVYLLLLRVARAPEVESLPYGGNREPPER